MNADTIKEFLVGLGFKVDEAGLKLFANTIKTATEAAVELGAATIAAATATVAAVSDMSERFEDLYYASQRIRSSVGNIKSYQFTIGQLGGTVEGARGSLEGLAEFMRSNPGGERFINSIGVATRNAKGQLRDTTDVMEDLGKKFKSMPFYRAKVYANILGIDEMTLMAMERGMDRVSDKYKKMYAAAGIDPQKAAEQAHIFMNRLREVEAHLEVTANVIAMRLAPAANVALNILDRALTLFTQLDQITDGWTSRLFALGTAWAVISKVLSFFNIGLGALVTTLIPRLLLYLGLAAEALGLEGLSGAFLALGAAIEATPIGWIITGIVALGVAGYELWKHWSAVAGFFGHMWDRIKHYFSEGWDYIRQIVHAMGKVLGQDWGDDGPPSRATPGPWDRPGQARGRVIQAGFPIPAAVSQAVSNAAGKAMEFFQRAGWSAAQAAGIVANIHAESGFRPGAVGDHGSAFGLAQWHRDRQAAFARWAGHDIRTATFQEQLGFINYELTQGTEQMAGRILKAAKGAFESGAIVSRYYERPAAVGANMQSRGELADWYARHNLTGGEPKVIHATVHAKSDIHVHGSTTPHETAKAVSDEQRRVNGDAVRNLKGAVR